MRDGSFGCPRVRRSRQCLVEVPACCGPAVVSRTGRNFDWLFVQHVIEPMVLSTDSYEFCEDVLQQVYAQFDLGFGAQRLRVGIASAGASRWTDGAADERPGRVCGGSAITTCPMYAQADDEFRIVLGARAMLTSFAAVDTGRPTRLSSSPGTTFNPALDVHRSILSVWRSGSTVNRRDSGRAPGFRDRSLPQIGAVVRTGHSTDAWLLLAAVWSD